MQSSKRELKVKLLLVRGSPRSNIPMVEQYNDKFPCDTLIVRYTPEFRAYQIMRDYFLEHKEYTHFVLATDDMVVSPEHVTQLQKDLEEYDLPVLSGVMNVDQDDNINLNIAWSIASKARSFRRYFWIHRDELPTDEDIFQVEFSGFPLMAIRRDIVEKWTFDADRVFEGKPASNGASLDLVFCWRCKENDIPIFVDKRIDMIHLRKAGKNMVHTLERKTEFVSANV
jgi:hypothetical protein